MLRLVVNVSLRFSALGLALVTAAGLAQSPGASRTNQPPPLPPPVLSQPPTKFFRELLAAQPAERERILAGRTLDQRTNLLNKISQYEAMPVEQREQQLRSLELRWHLLGLLRAEATNRPARLDRVAAADRPLVEDRLAYWDRLPSEWQKGILEHEAAIRLAISSQDNSPFRSNSFTNLPPEQRKVIENSIARWQALPALTQLTLYTNFQRLFDLNPSPPMLNVSATNTAPASLTRLMLEFNRLSPAEQQNCLTNFQRFTELPPDQRERFLKFAARWQTMTEAQRETWRRAARSRPPMPPPPLPPGARRLPTVSTAAQTTNK